MAADARRELSGGLLVAMPVGGSSSMEGIDDGAAWGFPLAEPGQGVAVSPSGERIAVLHRWGDGIGVFTRNGVPVGRFRRRGTLASPEIAFLDDDSIVAPAGEGFGPDAMLQIWSVAADAAPRTIEGPVPGGGFLFDRAKVIAVGGGGRWIVALCDQRNADAVVVADADGWKVRKIGLGRLLGRFDRVSAVGAADLIAVGTVGGRVLVVDPVSEELVREIVVYPRGRGCPAIGVGSVAFGDQGRLVATGRTISATGTVPERYGAAADGADGLKVWRVADGSLVRTASHDAGTARRIASGAGSFIAAFDAGLVFAPFDPSFSDMGIPLPGLMSVDVSPGDRAAVVVDVGWIRRVPLPSGP